MLWLVDRFALKNQTQQSAIICPQTFLIRFFALLIPAIFVPFLLTTLQAANIIVEYEKNPTSPKTLKRLNNIINPVAWQSRLDASVYSRILVSGLHEKSQTKLESYLTWSLTRIKHKPRATLYSNALLVLKILNRTEQYQQVLTEAKRTYPQKEDWQDNVLQKTERDTN